MSAFAFLWLLFFLLRIFYFDLRCEHLLVCHPNSSQNAWCGWLQWPDSIHFNAICSKPFPTGFPSETISLQISKTLFPCNLVISLNYESLHGGGEHIYIYTYTPILKVTIFHGILVLYWRLTSEFMAPFFVRIFWVFRKSISVAQKPEVNPCPS